MWIITAMFEKIKQYFFGGSIEKNGERPKIRIGERHETRSLPPLESAPKSKSVRSINIVLRRTEMRIELK